jgi:MFS family permease
LSSAWIIPALVGPALAGQVAEHASWRWVFIGIVPPMPIGAAMLLPSLARLPERAQSPDARPGGVFAALRLAAGVACLLFAAGATSYVVALLVGVLGLALTVPALAVLLPSGTFTGGIGLPAAVALRGLLAFGFFGSEALIPLGLSTQRGMPPSLVGLSLTAGALTWVIGSWAQDRAESRSAGSVSQRALRVAIGLALVAGGIGGVAAIILNQSVPVELVVVSWGLGGLGMGLAYPGTTLTALGNASSGQEGLAAAALQVAETVAVASGTGAAGALFALADHLQRAGSDGLGWGFVLSIASIVAAFIPTTRLAPRLLVIASAPRPKALD